MSRLTAKKTIVLQSFVKLLLVVGGEKILQNYAPPIRWRKERRRLKQGKLKEGQGPSRAIRKSSKLNSQCRRRELRKDDKMMLAQRVGLGASFLQDGCALFDGNLGQAGQQPNLGNGVGCPSFLRNSFTIVRACKTIAADAAHYGT